MHAVSEATIEDKLQIIPLKNLIPLAWQQHKLLHHNLLQQSPLLKEEEKTKKKKKRKPTYFRIKRSESSIYPFKRTFGHQRTKNISKKVHPLNVKTVPFRLVTNPKAPFGTCACREGIHYQRMPGKPKTFILMTSPSQLIVLVSKYLNGILLKLQLWILPVVGVIEKFVAGNQAE